MMAEVLHEPITGSNATYTKSGTMVALNTSIAGSVATNVITSIGSLSDYNHVDLNSTGTQIIAANANRMFGVLIKNLGISACYVAGSPVSITTGFELLKGDGIFLDVIDRIEGVCAAAKTATVSYIEV